MRKITCIECPRGCLLSGDNVDGKIIVAGNLCERGAKYYVRELTCPTRIVTTTVWTKDKKLISVKTDRPIKKELIFEIMQKIKQIVVLTNVKVGDIIERNLDNDGANLVATTPYFKEIK